MLLTSEVLGFLRRLRALASALSLSLLLCLSLCLRPRVQDVGGKKFAAIITPREARQVDSFQFFCYLYKRRLCAYIDAECQTIDNKY